jgi:hypothetical protein
MEWSLFENQLCMLTLIFSANRGGLTLGPFFGKGRAAVFRARYLDIMGSKRHTGKNVGSAGPASPIGYASKRMAWTLSPSVYSPERKQMASKSTTGSGYSRQTPAYSPPSHRRAASSARRLRIRCDHRVDKQISWFGQAPAVPKRAGHCRRPSPLSARAGDASPPYSEGLWYVGRSQGKILRPKILPQRGRGTMRKHGGGVRPSKPVHFPSTAHSERSPSPFRGGFIKGRNIRAGFRLTCDLTAPRHSAGMATG